MNKSTAAEAEEKNIEIKQNLKFFDPSHGHLGAMIALAAFLPFEKKRLFAEGPSSRTFKKFYQNRVRADKPLILTAKLLNHVLQGEQEKAKEILEKYPELLLNKGNCSDKAGRLFRNIKAFQGALWADDMHMYCMIENLVNSLPNCEIRKKLRDALKRQREDLEQTGITFEFKGITYEHQYYFNRAPLLEVLKEYRDNGPTWSKDQEKACWLRVGQLQQQFPACLAQEICNRSYYPNLPTFNEKTLSRSLIYYNWITNKKESWFDAAPSSTEGLGINFAICAAWGGFAIGREIRGKEEVKIELAAYSTYDKIRIKNRAALRLRQDTPAQEVEAERNGPHQY